MQNRRIPQEIATATMQGTRERGKTRKTWMNEVEEDRNKLE
jgi:hypothetical protein